VTSEPVIVPPDPDRQFILYVDDHSSQPEQFYTNRTWSEPTVVATPSSGLWDSIPRHLNKAEQNYPIYDRELLAIVRGLRNWRHLMRNTTHPVMVITDHANLQYYREPQKIGPRVNGYIVELADYNIQLVYNQETRTRPMNCLGDPIWHQKMRMS